MRISADQLELWSSRTEHWVLHSFVNVARIRCGSSWAGSLEKAPQLTGRHTCTQSMPRTHRRSQHLWGGGHPADATQPSIDFGEVFFVNIVSLKLICMIYVNVGEMGFIPMNVHNQLFNGVRQLRWQYHSPVHLSGFYSPFS